MIKYAEAEVEALLLQNMDVVLALRSALVEHGTLSGDEIDDIISACVAVRAANLERQRRIDWKERHLNAAAFQIDGTLQ